MFSYSLQINFFFLIFKCILQVLNNIILLINQFFVCINIHSILLYFPRNIISVTHIVYKHKQRKEGKVFFFIGLIILCEASYLFDYESKIFSYLSIEKKKKVVFAQFHASLPSLSLILRALMENM